MAKDILLIVGGADAMWREFERGVGYWSAAFHVILEKRGWLCFDIAGPEILENGAALAQYDAYTVGRLNREDVLPGALERLFSLGKPVFIEGPLPFARVGPLRVGAERKIAPDERDRLTIAPGFAERLAKTCWASFDPKSPEVDLNPREFQLNRKNFDHTTAHHRAAFEPDMRRCAELIALTTLYMIRNRVTRNGRFFDPESTNAVAALAARVALVL
jgi:hypothetical protein